MHGQPHVRHFICCLRIKKRHLNTPKQQHGAEQSSWETRMEPTGYSYTLCNFQYRTSKAWYKMQVKFIYMKLPVTVYDNYTDTQTSCAQQRHSVSFTSQMVNSTDAFPNTVTLQSVWHIPGDGSRNLLALSDPLHTPPSPRPQSYF